MQLYSLKTFKTKLLKLQLLKSQLCKKKLPFESGRLKDVTFRLKKLISIIFKFHTLNKKILFVEASLHKRQRLTCLTIKTKHAITSKSLWANGTITNRLSKIKRVYKSKKPFEAYYQLEKKFDLVIVLDEFSTLTVLKEGHVFKIPLSSLHADLSALNTKVTYKVPGNFNFTEESCLFYSVLYSVLKKTKSGKA